MRYYYDYSYFVFMIPALVVTIFAQMKVKTTFKNFFKVPSSNRITGAEAAKRVLVNNGVTDVTVLKISGELTDHFDPRTKTINLSSEVYNSTSVAAIGVAAHEAGHAVQKEENYAPMTFRNFIVPITKFCSSLSMPLIFIGILWPTYSEFFIMLGIIFFSFTVIFHLITLPVEFNASSRAIKSLEDSNILVGEEVSGAKKVLSAAAMTYLAATLTSVLSLLRLILVYGKRGGDNR